MPQQPGGWVDASQVKPFTPQTGGWVGAEEVKPAAAAPKADSGGVGGFAREFWKRTNPLEAIKGLAHAAGDIPGTVKGLISANPEFLTQAQEAAGKGDYTTALRKVLSYAAMGLGPELDTQADLLQQGRYAEGAGAMAGTATNLAGPAVAAKAIGGARVPAIAAPRDPAVARAVASGQRAGVPMDAATATNNPFVKFAQKTADESLLGSFVGQRAKSQQAAGMTRWADDLAGQAHPSPVSPIQAGEAAQVGARSAVKAARGAADDAYTRLRAIEADPKNLATIEPPVALGTAPRQPVRQVPMAVDITATKAKVARPLYDKLARKKELTGSLMGAEGNAFTRLDALLNGPDVVPLSVADAALSDFKRMARTNNPDLRSVGQGIAAKVTGELGRDVMNGARAAGPEAVTALTEGRLATIAKYAAERVLNKVEGVKVPKEPVAAFDGMTYAGDASVRHLQKVIQQTPTSKPLIGRAVLDGLIDSPTMGPDASFKAWHRMGPQSKAVLYAPDHIKALDDFFLLRKKIAENPNPSGSGLTVLKGGELYMRDPGLTVGLPVLSALLHSKAGVALLTKGFRLPGASKVAMAGYASALTKAAERAGTPILAPSFAGDER